MNKVISLSIILAMVPCAGISAMHLATAEKAVREPRGRQRLVRRLDFADGNPEYEREYALQQQMAVQHARQQRQQELDRYNEFAPEGAPYFPRNL